MDVSHLLADLNKDQRSAVTSEAQHLLVLAGAGSGKTRVLIHRIAWLIEVFRAPPSAILAVTFTNKAAGEMRQRAEELLGSSARGLWVGTFHGIAHRLLRMHFDDAGLPENFQILDSEDQLRLLRRTIKDMDLDESKWPARKAQWYIGGLKDEGIRAESVETGDDPIARCWRDIYSQYEQACERAGVVDFAELLLRAHELWLRCPDILDHYRQRFAHVLVDEFQDTNAIQYAWIQLLAGRDNGVFVVGDDDQSIYGWRGARIENMHHFQSNYPATETIRLEQNYRSTGNILTAANAVIANNAGRLGKNLWTSDASGELIQVYPAYNEAEEGFFVVDRIRQWLDEGRSASEVAVLYRSNAQSRVFEEQLISRQIPYRVYGGLRFFERAEIKDALGFLRLVATRVDDTAFERVVNVPVRGIGARTVDSIRATARARSITLWEAARVLVTELGLAPRAARAVSGFIALIDELEAACEGLELGDTIARVIEHTELLTHYEKEGVDRYEARRDNLKELVTAGQTFVMDVDDRDSGLSELDAFLARAALEAGEAQGEAWEDCVQLMSLHSAKGLEFPLVFLAGMEEGLFPHQRSVEEDRLEEERRLCYVGITRAREQLYISYAEVRRWQGTENHNRPSRFVFELPNEVIKDLRPRARSGGRRDWTRAAATAEVDAFKGHSLGDRVIHQSFGEGVIIDMEGSGAHARVHVNFEDAGTKILVLAYANLEKL